MARNSGTSSTSAVVTGVWSVIRKRIESGGSPSDGPLSATCAWCHAPLDICGIPPPAGAAAAEKACIVDCGHVVGHACLQKAIELGTNSFAGVVACPICPAHDLACNDCRWPFHRVAVPGLEADGGQRRQRLRIPATSAELGKEPRFLCDDCYVRRDWRGSMGLPVRPVLLPQSPEQWRNPASWPVGVEDKWLRMADPIKKGLVMVERASRTDMGGPIPCFAIDDIMDDLVGNYLPGRDQPLPPTLANEGDYDRIEFVISEAVRYLEKSRGKLTQGGRHPWGFLGDEYEERVRAGEIDAEPFPKRGSRAQR